MAEPFGIAAGILTVIEVSTKVIKKCKHIIETTHDAPRDLCHIFVEISSLKSTLESLKYLNELDCDFSDGVRQLDRDDGAIKKCRDTIEDLAAGLDGLSIPQSFSSESKKRRRLQGALKWSLKESKAMKLLDEALHHKSTITLALLGEVAQDVKKIKQDVGQLRENMSIKDLRDVCGWLERINPTSDHNNALKLPEDRTSHWLGRLDPYTNWLAGSTRFLWIHGIPGAGKTVLLSYIVERTREFCSKSSDTSACVYFYCSYRHTGDQTVLFMRWLVGQLSRNLNSVPEEVINLHHSNSEPTLAQLKNALVLLLENISAVYVLLDAVDECNTRDDLLQLITDLMGDTTFEKLRLIATSRLYSDIERAFLPISETVSMSNPLVDEDIRLYVDTELRTREKFRTWPQELLSYTLDALVKGARGMFRWATCQLYILQRK